MEPTRRVASALTAVARGLVLRGEQAPRAVRRMLEHIHPGAGTHEPRDDIPLTDDESRQLNALGEEDWSRVDPQLFGILFQASLAADDRHARGVHYTRESDIQRVIQPTLVGPWRRRIAAARTEDDLHTLHAELCRFRVLDPACGCGDFLVTSFRALKQLERPLLDRLGIAASAVRVTQCLGIDIDPTAVAIARMVLQLAARQAGDPTADLDATIVTADALFCDWPAADAIVGNPPFQAKNKARQQLGAAYMARLRQRYPDVPGRADHCVHWFRRAHDVLPPGGRAGLVATNTIRDNDSRRASLEYILMNGATITDAVATQPWQGDADVHVSIVNWIKGEASGPHNLWHQLGDTVDGPWVCHTLARIPASLSPRVDVTAARVLTAHTAAKSCFQGQTPGHRAFIVDPTTTATWLHDDVKNGDVLFPYLVGDDLLDAPGSAPSRHILDFADLDLDAASLHRLPFAHLAAHVLPARQAAAAQESARNAAAALADPRARQNHHHANFLAHWWRPAYRRDDLLAALLKIPRYIACSRVTRRPIFTFVPAHVRPGDALQVFTFADDYSFGVLQSHIHWQWFTARCSALKLDPRYTSSTVYDTFPWPQFPAPDAVAAVEIAALQLLTLRSEHADTGLRALHRRLEATPDHPLHAAHAALDAAVRHAYRMPAAADPLAFLLDLNAALAVSRV